MPVLEQSLWKYVNQADSGWKGELAHRKTLSHREDPVLSRDNDEQEVRIRVKDLQRRGGASLVLEDDKVGPEDTLIRGYFFNRDFRSGLKLSCSNTKEEHAFTTSSVHDAGLSCMFFLQGRVGAHIGNHHIDFNADANGDVICAAGALKQCSQPFKRVTKTAQYVRHLVVTATPDWLASSGFEQYIGQNLNQGLNQQTIVSRQWSPSARLSRIIKEVFSPSVLVPELLDLHLEARSLDIVSETLTALIQSDGCLSSVAQLDRHSLIRI